MNLSHLSELDRIKVKIRALADKTVANGCTEHEAMSAMAGVGRLLSQYNLSMSELDVRTSNYKQIELDIGRARRHPIDGCITALARLIDGKTWFSRRYAKSSAYVFFGEANDLELVKYLFHVILNAMDTETKLFKKSEQYKVLARSSVIDNGDGTFNRIVNHGNGRRKSATTSFQRGMAARIGARLLQIKAENDAALKAKPTGTSLMVLKKQIVTEEFNKTGIRLTKVHSQSRIGNWSAFGAGQEAGNKVNLSRPLKNGSANIGGYLS